MRVSTRDLVELQREALRAMDLEAETAALKLERLANQRETRAHQLLAAAALPAEEAAEVWAAVTIDLPRAADGSLHEAAFNALVQVQVWERLLARPTDQVRPTETTTEERR